MPIDWFTIGAQVFNFLLLVALLRIFLYRPILDAMDRREEKITSRLEEAEQKRDDAEDQQRKLEQQRRDFEENKDSLLTEVREDAEKRRKQLVEEAREKADAARDKWLSQVDEERDSFLQDLRRRVARETCSLARKALANLADAKLEEQMTRLFLARLGKEHDSIKGASMESGVIVRSAFDLTKSVRDEVRKTLQDLPGGGDEPRFETDSDLLCGIELRIGDRKIGWSVEGYLDDFEGRLKEAIAEK
jgi:F-type H+-transporting ATPase subunit b